MKYSKRFCMVSEPPVGQSIFHFDASRSHTRTTVSRTHFDEGSAHRIDLYLTTHTPYQGQTLIPRAGFETTVPASERLWSHALDRAATGISNTVNTFTVGILYETIHATANFFIIVQCSVWLCVE
jgi:hypothetical protein